MPVRSEVDGRDLNRQAREKVTRLVEGVAVGDEKCKEELVNIILNIAWRAGDSTYEGLWDNLNMDV